MCSSSRQPEYIHNTNKTKTSALIDFTLSWKEKGIRSKYTCHMVMYKMGKI